MWTFDNPGKLLQEKYGFTPTTGWLDHLRLPVCGSMTEGQARL